MRRRSTRLVSPPWKRSARSTRGERITLRRRRETTRRRREHGAGRARLPLGIRDEARNARSRRSSPSRKASSTSTSRPGRRARPSDTCSRTRAACPSTMVRRSRPSVERRIYSNQGFDALAAHVAERAGDAVRPLPRGGRARAARDGSRSCAAPQAPTSTGRSGTARRSRGSCSRPRSSPARRSPRRPRSQFPGLAGVLPDYGRFDPMDWGLGFELKDAKAPHWTGTLTSPRTFGHFGGRGTFLWVDPERALACGRAHRPRVRRVVEVGVAGALGRATGGSRAVAG